MKTFEITKEQILDLINCSNKIKVDYRLKEWFPQAFQSELEVGKWYKVNLFEEKLYCFTKFEQCDGFVKRYYYGFSGGNFREDYTASRKLDDSWTLATEKEVETALIAEAKRRGLVDGVFIKSFIYGKSFLKGDRYYISNGIFKLNGNWLMKDGKWAEICEEPIELTLEQIAEKFNVNVEQLKIKK